MNILHLRASNFYGGAERQIHLHALQAQGPEFKVAIASFSENAKEPDFLGTTRNDGIKTHLFNVRNAYDPSAILTLRRYLRENDIRILCTHDYRSNLISYLATRRTKCRWIAFSRGYTRDSLRVRIYGLMDRVYIRFADHIVTVSHAQKRKLSRLLIPGRKISAIHDAVDVDRLCRANKADLRSKFDFPPEAIICISGGRFSREKGQIYLVRATAKAIQRNNLLRFVLFGDGPDLENTRSAVVRFGLESRVLCPGFEKNLFSYLKSADILINPSLSEGLPNIVLEAMALGIPVLATAVGGVPEIISHAQNGYLVPPKSPRALSDGILFMASNKDKVSEFARAAREMVETQFTFENQNRKLTELYRNLSD